MLTFGNRLILECRTEATDIERDETLTTRNHTQVITALININTDLRSGSGDPDAQYKWQEVENNSDTMNKINMAED